jgi:glutamine amidotransferase PdxT
LTPKLTSKTKILAVSTIILAIILSALLVPPYLNSISNSSEGAIIIPMQTSQQPNWINASKLINTLLQLNFKVYLLSEPIGAISGTHRGDFVIPVHQQSAGATSMLSQYILYLSKQLNVTITQAGNTQANVYPLNQAKVAVYYGGGVSGGSLEHIHALEQAGFSLSTVNQNNMNIGDLSQFNVLTFPGGGPYLNALNENDTNGIKQFVNAGGGYLGTCGGSVLGVELGLLDVQNVMKNFTGVMYEDWSDSRGPVILNVTDSNSLIVNGYSGNVTSTYYRGPFISQVGSGVDVVCTYQAATPDLAVFDPETMNDPVNIEKYHFTLQPNEINLYWGTPSIVSGSYGQGKVVLSTTHPEILSESQRLFVNCIFYLSSGSQIRLNTQQPNSSPDLQTGSLEPLSTAAISQANEVLSQLHQKAQTSQNTISGMEQINYEDTGATGDYMELYVDDVASRTKALIGDLGTLTADYSILQASNQTSLQINGTQISTESAQKIINYLLGLNGKLDTLNSVNQQLSNEMNMLQHLPANGTSQYYQAITDLNRAESTTLYTLKDQVDFDLLNLTFQIHALTVEIEFLNYQAGQR